jgi:hypothetical protein
VSWIAAVFGWCFQLAAGSVVVFLAAFRSQPTAAFYGLFFTTTNGKIGTTHYFLPRRLFRFAVRADLRKASFVGAPDDPGLRIFSPDPLRIRSRFALMFA